jgi:hypothetical protein
VGPGPHIRDWAVGFSGDEKAHYRRRWRAPHAAVRLLCTRRPTPEEYDSWARGPMSETGPLLSAEVKRCTTAGGGVLLTRRFAFSAHGGRRSKSMTRGPGTPVSETGLLLSVKVKRCTTAGGGMLLMWRFAFSAHGGRRSKSMTHGLGPLC